MNFNQTFSILLWLYKSKANSKGLIKGVENALQVKAGREDFAETNLTVITADGTLHEFTVTWTMSGAYFLGLCRFRLLGSIYYYRHITNEV